METIRVAGYVRVSTPRQVDDESLNTQRESIKKFCKQQGYQLIEIYADEGISGGSIKDRHALLRCMYDGQSGKFKILIVHRLSRFGRNANELLNNHKELKNAGIELRSISEGIDFSSKYGEFMLTMLAAVAQLDSDIIREQMLENRIAKTRRGIPAMGSMPWGRKYVKETGEWIIKEGAKELIEKAAEDYLNGKTLVEICKYLNMTTPNLLWIFKVSAGDKWTIQFKGEPPIVYTIPRLLPDETIEKLKERIGFNRRNNRTDIVNKYVLSGFVRCDKCGGLFTGRTQRYKVKSGEYHYQTSYAHVTRPRSDCPGISIIDMDALERAVFETIFENIVDVPNFERAIKDSMPDQKMITNLKNKIKEGEKRLKRIQKDLDSLVESVLNKTLSAETISKKEQELLYAKSAVNEQLEKDKLHLKSLPDIDDVRKEAGNIRRQLLIRYSGKKRLLEMTYDEKRELLHRLFDGQDYSGAPYGIFVLKHPDKRVDYFLYGKLSGVTGLRTLKGDNINYQKDEENGITKKVDQN